MNKRPAATRCWTLALEIILKIIFKEQKARRDPVLDIGFRNPRAISPCGHINIFLFYREICF